MDVIGCNVRCAERKYVGSRSKLAGVRKVEAIHQADVVAWSTLENVIRTAVSATECKLQSRIVSVFLL